MKKTDNEIRNVADLKEEILSLRMRSERQTEHLHSTYLEFKRSITPMNIARQAAGALSQAGKNSQLVSTVFEYGGGVAAKKILFGNSGGFFGRLWSAGVDFMLSRMVPHRGKIKRSFQGRSIGTTRPGKISGNISERTSDKTSGAAQIILGKDEVRFKPSVDLMEPVG